MSGVNNPFKVVVDGETVYETPFEADTVQRVRIASGSEGADVGFLVGDNVVELSFDRVDPVESNFLDVTSDRERRATATEREKASADRVAEGRRLTEEQDRQQAENHIQPDEVTTGRGDPDPDNESASDSEKPAKATASSKK